MNARGQENNMAENRSTETIGRTINRGFVPYAAKMMTAAT
jgi:hypothetical protein